MLLKLSSLDIFWIKKGRWRCTQNITRGIPFGGFTLPGRAQRLPEQAEIYLTVE